MIRKTNLSQRQFKSGAQIFGCDSIIWSVKTDAKYEGIPKLSVPKQLIITKHPNFWRPLVSVKLFFFKILIGDLLTN